MSDLPKIVYDRLRAASPQRDSFAREHPDADLLTAFVEQVLSGVERERVLDHLALCGDCRHAIVLAMQPVEIATATVPHSEQTERDRIPIVAATKANWWSGFLQPNLAWAALPAGVAVVVLVLALHPARQDRELRASLDRPGTNQPATNQPAMNQPAVATTPSASDPQAASSSLNQPVAAAKGDEVRSKTALPFSARQRSEPIGIETTGSKKLAKPAPFAGNQKRAESSDTSNNNNNKDLPSPENALMARNIAPAIEKAKPARQEDMTAPESTGESTRSMPAASSPDANAALAAAPSPGHEVTWTIVSGVLQRSLDAGQTWQTALRAEHPLLSYASQDKEVWAGGEAGALFHSSDSGLTWTQVQPSFQAQAIISDVTHIDLRSIDLRSVDLRNDAMRNNKADRASAIEIVVSTGAGEIWTSSDAGKTWSRQ